MQGRAAPKRVGCGWSSGARQSRVIEANLLRVAAELPIEPVGSRPERMPDGSIAADDHRVLQQLVRVLEHGGRRAAASISTVDDATAAAWGAIGLQ